jgi:hypothetical protein
MTISLVSLWRSYGRIGFVLATGFAFGVPAAPALAVQVDITLNFTSVRRSEYGGLGLAPPDTMGAVGEDHIVEFINGLYRVFDKSTGAVLQNKPSYRFWYDTGIFIGDGFDPRVAYDPFTRHWYALETDGVDYLFAVSSSANPTEGWKSFRINSGVYDGRSTDFPMLGFNADAVYLSANIFKNDFPVATSVVVLPKADLLAPTPTISNRTEFQNISTFLTGLAPQQTIDLDNTSGTAFMGSQTGIPGIIQLPRVTNTGSTPMLDGGVAALVFVDPGAGGTPVAATQPGPSQPLNVLDEKFTSNLVLQNGSLWSVRMVNGFGGEVTAQWFEFDPETRIELQSGVISEPGLNLIYPSIAVNDFDQVVIGFTGVGENEFAGAYAVVGETIGGVTTFGDPILLKAGESEFELISPESGQNRWGDYSATVVDPEDPRVFWTFQEWAAGPDDWATQITQLILVPEPSTAVLLACSLACLAARWRPRA